MPHDHPKKTTRRSFLDWLIALFSTIAGAAMAIPAMMYLWPAAKGGAAEDVEVKNAGSLKPGDSAMVQVRGKRSSSVRSDGILGVPCRLSPPGLPGEVGGWAQGVPLPMPCGGLQQRRTSRLRSRPPAP